MIINKLYLKEFGKFTNKEIEFSPRLNIFYGSNEAGKSTISNALKTFFYTELTGKGKYKKNGIPLSKDKGLFDVAFSLDNGKNLKSLITLGKTNAKTLVKTVDEDTGEALGFDGSKCGEHFFNLTEDMFDSVCYVKDLESISNVIGAKSDVHDKLSKTENNIIDVDLSDVIKKTKDELLALQRKTPTGKIYPLEKRVEEINNILYNISSIKDSLGETDNKISSLKNEYEKLKKELDEIYKKEEYIKKYKEYSHAKEQIMLEEEIKNTEAKLLKEETGFLEIPSDELEKIRKLSAFDNRTVKNSSISLIAGIIICVISIILSFVNVYFSSIILLSALFFISFYKTKKENESILKNQSEYYSLLKKYNITDIEDYSIKKDKYYKDENEKNLNIQKLQFLKSQLSDYNKEYINTYLEKPHYSENELKYEEDRLKNRLTQITISINSIDEQKKNAFNNMPDFDSLTEEKDELLKRIERLKEEEQIITHCLDIFTLTNNSFKSSYIPYLNKEVKNILSKILGVNIDHFNINDDLTCEIRKEDSSDIISKEYFSKGTDAIIYFALRLAIYKLIVKDEKIPFILDDCFLELDDERFEKVFDYLSQNVNSQIIYFTAHKRIFNLPLAKDGINKL